MALLDSLHQSRIITIIVIDSAILQRTITAELRKLAIRRHFVPQETHGRTRGARLVCLLGCAAFEDNMASSNHVTNENWSLHVATLSIHSSTLHCNYGCIRLASLGRPRSAPVRSNSFDVILGAHLGQPPVPCLWSGSLGGCRYPRCMTIPREGGCDRSISSRQGSTYMEANQTHPKFFFSTLYRTGITTLLVVVDYTVNYCYLQHTPA